MTQIRPYQTWLRLAAAGTALVSIQTAAAPLYDDLAPERRRTQFLRIGYETELPGHWRNTTITFGSPIDVNLLLRADGLYQRWTVTASGRSPVEAGRWTISGKELQLLTPSGEREAMPFTLHQGQLVYPNIPNQRGFWERVGR